MACEGGLSAKGETRLAGAAGASVTVDVQRRSGRVGPPRAVPAFSAVRGPALAPARCSGWTMAETIGRASADSRIHGRMRESSACAPGVLHLLRLARLSVVADTRRSTQERGSCYALREGPGPVSPLRERRAQRRQTFGPHPIVGPPPALIPLHEPRLAEHAQMVANGGLAEAQRFGPELTNRVQGGPNPQDVARLRGRCGMAPGHPAPFGSYWGTDRGITLARSPETDTRPQIVRGC